MQQPKVVKETKKFFEMSDDRSYFGKALPISPSAASTHSPSKLAFRFPDQSEKILLDEKSKERYNDKSFTDRFEVSGLIAHKEFKRAVQSKN